MKIIKILILLLISVNGFTQPFIRGSIQQGTTANSIDVVYLPDHNSTAGAYVNNLSISVAIPLSSATGVTPTISGVGNFASLAFSPADPFTYTQGSEKIYSWICANATPLTMSWTTGVSFIGARVTFNGGTGSAKIRMVDFISTGGGVNGNTLFSIGINVLPFDLTNYGNVFYAIPGVNGSTTGAYPNTDTYGETNQPVLLSALCPAPAVPTVSNITTTTADIAWNAVAGSAGYEYEISTNALPTAPGTAILATSFNATTLLPGTLYYFHVRNDCGGGNFSQWSTVSFTTVVSCPEPSMPTVTNLTTTSADIDWVAVPGAAGFEYELSTNIIPSGTGTAIGGTTYNAGPLTSATTYYFHLRTDCGSGNFSNWVTAEFTTICDAPVAPTISNVTETSADINWLAVSPGVGGYEYFVSTDPLPPLAGAFTPNTNITANGLIHGTLYYAYLRSSCTSGEYSAWASTTFITPCKKPSAPIISNIVGSNADIRWFTLPGGTSGYEYFVNTDSVPPASGTFTADTSFHATGLNSFTTYYVHLRTSCGSGEFSSWVRTAFSTSCFKPELFVISNPSETGTAHLGWNAVNGAIRYEYAILRTAAHPGGSLAFTVDTTLFVLGLEPGLQYYLHVRTHCGPVSFSEWTALKFHTSGLDIYPNPVHNNVTIRIFGEVLPNEEIVVYDAIGRRVIKMKPTGTTATINMSNLASGVYFVKYGTNKQFIKQIIKK